MVELGKPEVIAGFRAQGWQAKYSALIMHANKYGYALRLQGMTGPKLSQHPNHEEALEALSQWVEQDPERNCGFDMTRSALFWWEHETPTFPGEVTRRAPRAEV